MILSFFALYTRRVLWCLRHGFDIRVTLLCDVSQKATIPRSTSFSHPLSIVIGDNVIIGENCIIRQCVTIGGIGRDVPIIGNGVEIGAHAILLGKIRIGDNARIGAGAIVLSDVPAGCTVVGVWKDTNRY